MMKRFLQLALVVAVIAASAFVTKKWLFSSEENPQFVLLEAPKGIEVLPSEKEDEKEGIDYWMRFSQMARANQVTGDISMEDVMQAKQSHAALKERLKNRRASNLGIQFESMGPSNKGGRTRDILFDKNNPDRVYAGGVSGGLYISNNGGNSWSPYLKNDTLAGIGIASLAQTTNGDIYVGTGEYISSGRAVGIGRSLSFIGDGIWKSSDGGNTFHRLEATAPNPDNSNSATFAFINELAAHPTDGSTILAGTARGLQISTDGGQTWNRASDALTMRNRDIQDIDVTADGTVHVSVAGEYWKGKINDAGSFENIKFGASFEDMKLSVAPSNPNYVYAIGCNAAGETNGVFRSVDGGNTWRNIGPSTLPSESFNPTGTQGTYDMEIGVHPLDENIAYTAGQFAVYEYNYSEENGQGNDFWWPITNWWSGSPAFDQHYVHADHHRFVFHPEHKNVMYIATDGGIYRTKNASRKYPNPPIFEQLNKGYGVAQFNDISTNLNGQIIGGTQDNGVLILDFDQNEYDQAFRAPGFGDGGYCEASKINNNAFFASSYFGILARSSNSGDGFSGFYDGNIDANGDRLPDASAPFVPVSHLYEFTDKASSNYGKGLFFWAPFDGIWVAYDALDFGAIPVWFHIATPQNGLDLATCTYTAMDISADGNHLYVASGNSQGFGPGQGAVYRISGLKDVEWKYDDNGTPTDPDDDFFDPATAGITVTKIASFPTRFVTDVAVDKNNAEHVVVSLGNYGNNSYIYRSTNAASTNSTTSFSSIQNNLPKMPVYSVQIDYYDSKNILAGTELGVYSSSLNGASWEPEFNGLPTTPVLTLNQEQVNDLEGDCYILYAGTYGKSAYASSSLSPTGCIIPRGNSTGIAATPNVVNSDLNVYPNPASNNVNLSFALEKTDKAKVLMYNLEGQMVMQESLGTLSAGKHNKQIDLSGIAKGNYLIVVRSGNNQAVAKLNVMR